MKFTSSGLCIFTTLNSTPLMVPHREMSLLLDKWIVIRSKLRHQSGMMTRDIPPAIGGAGVLPEGRDSSYRVLVNYIYG
jgi:hypothetical protein